MAAPVTDFLKTLEASGLLPPEEQESLRTDAEVASLDAQTLAIRLVQKNRLTAYQAKQLLAGRSRGFILGKYKILETLGQGGMGMVFKAQHLETGRLAAVKVLPPKSATSRESVARFHREARATAHLDHPYIVQAYDVGQQGDAHYIAMEFVAGKNLGILVKDCRRLPPGMAAGIIRQVALGLQHALARNLIHRDIKPSNIMVTPDGTAKILDLGLARFFGNTADEPVSQMSLTQTGAVMGTVDYIAPEQADDSHRADTRSDIYSLGCTLYQCLTGQVPFPEGSVMQKLLKHRERDPVAIDLLVPDVPEGLAAVVRRMMAKRPEDRFQNPSDVSDALSPFAEPWSSDALTKVPALRRSSDLAGAVEATVPATAGQLGFWLGPGEAPHSMKPDPSAGRTAIAGTVSDTAGELASDDILAAIAAAAAAAPPQTGTTGLRKMRWNRVHTITLATVAATALLMFGIRHWVESDNGTLAIRFSQPELFAPTAQSGRAKAKVVLDGRVLSTEGIEQEVIRVFPGPHTLSVDWPGFESVKKDITVRRGERLEFEVNPSEQTVRRIELAPLEQRLSQVSTVTPEGERVKAFTQLRADLKSFGGRHRGTREGTQALSLLARLPCAADTLNRTQVPAYELAMAGAGDAKNVPSELVAIWGDSRFRHWCPVTCVAISPDGKTIASGSSDSTIKLWSAENGQEQRTFYLGNYPVSAVAFTPDGLTLAAAGTNGNLQFWDTATGELRRTIKAHKDGVIGMSFGPNGERLASAGSSDHRVLIWEVATGEKVCEFEEQAAELTAIAWSSDGRTIATGSSNGAVKLWDADTGELQKTLDGHVQPVWEISFHPTEETVASCSLDGTVRLWNAATGEESSIIEAASKPVRTVSFSPDGRWLAWGTDDSIVQVWDVRAGEVRHRLEGHRGPVSSLAFRPDGRGLVSACGARLDPHDPADRVLKLWDLESGKELLKFGNWPHVNSIAFSPDGRTMAGAFQDSAVRLWDVATAKERTLFTEHAGDVSAVAYSPDGKTLASGGTDQWVRIWDIATGKERRSLAAHTAGITSLAYSPDNRLVASASHDATVIVWDLAKGEILKLFHGHEGTVNAVAFSPDGKTLASAGNDKTVKIWDIRSGKELQTIPTQDAEVVAIAFNPDGKTLAFGCLRRRPVTIWDIAKNAALLKIECAGPVTDLVFSPDGEFLAAGTGGNTVQIWTKNGVLRTTFAIDGRAPLIFPDERSPIGPHVAFSPEGRHLAAANGNGTICMFRLASYEPIDSN